MINKYHMIWTARWGRTRYYPRPPRTNESINDLYSVI